MFEEETRALKTHRSLDSLDESSSAILEEQQDTFRSELTRNVHKAHSRFRSPKEEESELDIE